MAAGLHGSARTTPRVRAELQAPQDKTSALARQYGLSRNTVGVRDKCARESAGSSPCAGNQRSVTGNDQMVQDRSQR